MVLFFGSLVVWLPKVSSYSSLLEYSSFVTHLASASSSSALLELIALASSRGHSWIIVVPSLMIIIFFGSTSAFLFRLSFCLNFRSGPCLWIAFRLRVWLLLCFWIFASCLVHLTSFPLRCVSTILICSRPCDHQIGRDMNFLEARVFPNDSK